MAEVFDVIIIGGGPAGEHAVGRATDAGLSTLLVESELAGGECSYWACMPSKTLLRPTQVLHVAAKVPGAREAITGTVDVNEALARRNWMVSDWDDAGQVRWVENTGATFVRGKRTLRRSTDRRGHGERRLDDPIRSSPRSHHRRWIRFDLSPDPGSFRDARLDES